MSCWATYSGHFRSRHSVNYDQSQPLGFIKLIYVGELVCLFASHTNEYRLLVSAAAANTLDCLVRTIVAWWC